MAALIIRLLLMVSLVRMTTSLCPLLGPDFPPPRNISQNPGFRKALDSLSSVIHRSLNTASGALAPFDPTNTTFSINIFSTFSGSPLYEYHHIAPHFVNGSIGTKKVDGDTVYRIGSISKLFTVFALLIEKGDVNFNDPITKYVPELMDVCLEQSGAVNAVQWNDVTLGALASQMSGIGRDYSLGDFAWLGPELVGDGFPPLNASDLPTCAIGIPGVPTCDRAAFFRGFLHRHPVFAPSTTPIYSNVAFRLLAYALENMASKSFNSIVSKNILKPLHMSRTSTSLPKNSSVGAIPGHNTTSGWDSDWGDDTPAGGIYSTSNDLAKLGRAILRNTLLPPAQTRRWMKPVTHTSSLTTSVGAPWEILRATTSRGVVDLYTKGGDVGVYSSLLTLVPDFDIGWAILSAADTLTTAAVGVEVFADLITEVLFPAIEAAAKDSAAVTFAGTYKATNGLNSSISILTDSLPGLNIQSWISNGTDALEAYLAVKELTNVNSTVRLYPTNLFQDSPKQQAFRAVADVLPRNSTGGVFSSGCGTWVGVDAPTYGNVGVDEFVFHFDEYGRAVSVEPRAFRVTLKKGLKV